MKKKMLFFDIDGTLLDHDKNLVKSAKEAIKYLKSEGHELAIATGRAPFMFKELREELGIDSYVSFNGQYVVKNSEVIYKNPINTEILQMLTNHAVLNNHPLVYMDQNTMKSNVEYHPHVEASMASLHCEHPMQDSNHYINKEIYQTLIFCKDSDEAAYKNTFQNLHFIRWHKYSMDCIPIGASKAGGIKKLIDLLGFKQEEIYAFGDGLNDIEMLQFAGNSVAMGNAPDIVKNNAKFVTKDVSDNGIVHGLELLGLLN